MSTVTEQRPGEGAGPARPSSAHRFRSRLARTSLGLTSALSMSGVQRLGRGLAFLGHPFARRARLSTKVNLELCFPGMDTAERRRLVRASLTEAFTTLLELGPLWRWKRERVLALVREVRGQESLDAAMAKGQGVVLIGPHLGAWELVGLYASAHYPVTSLYRSPRVLGLEPVYKNARERFGARLAPANASGVRTLYRALRSGEVVGVLPDQDPGHGAGIFAPFFGVPANTSTLTARLLMRTKATPLFTWAERLPRGAGYRIHFIEPSAGLQSCGDLEQLTRNLNREIESLVRRWPHHYLWSYRRFRQRPPGERNPYRYGIGQLRREPQAPQDAARASFEAS